VTRKDDSVRGGIVVGAKVPAKREKKKPKKQKAQLPKAQSQSDSRFSILNRQ